MQSLPAYRAPVPGGPLAYRRQLRSRGAVAGLLPQLVLGSVAVAALFDNTSPARGALGFLCAVLAAPGLLVAGAPLTTGAAMFAGAIGASAVLWLTIGQVAARRATRSPAADWRDYWREYLWLAAGVWLGVVVALVAVNLVLGRPFV
ncbi:MAG: hypothetical protein Q7V57_02385 [Actinomycetota bacterium]|nr:hypothetical protein [Actinomycetota bacterium]